MLLPLSLLPLGGAIPLVLEAHSSYLRYYVSPAFAAPANVLTAAERAQFTTLPAFTGAIPVLVYHGIGSAPGADTVSRRAFAAQMQTLHLAGYRTVSIAQYARFQQGDATGLPARPILITFDGGRLDSFRGADRILAREDFRATMFVVTGNIADRNPLYLDWTELHRMRQSGRWDIQPESYQGATEVAVDRRGDLRPFYAMRRYLRSTGPETFAAYQRRVGGDLFTLAGQFSAQGIPIHAIALPFGDYGQLDPGNDPRVVPFVLGLLRTQFGTVFVQSAGNDPSYDTAAGGGPQQRWAAGDLTTPEQLYSWLRAHDPGASPAAHSNPTTVTPVPQRPRHGVKDVRHHQLRRTTPRRRAAAHRT
jgi:peptidoglycan/xylan/chitin deacetylase (PgdA/CDA1 family)